MLEGFVGEQEQVAPLFSAKSIDGVRAYEMARRAYKQAASSGEGFDHSATELLSRQRIEISSLKLVSFGEPVRDIVEYKPNPRINVTDISQEKGLVNAEILVDCSKGTYIRALARDWGEALGSGAFLNNLRRTRCGDFKVEEALSIEEALECFG
jgi:tRNA pseudouridine55 synthase